MSGTSNRPQRDLQANQKSAQSPCPNYALYEQCKAEWIAANPGASQVAYDCAMQSIARECGV